MRKLLASPPAASWPSAPPPVATTTTTTAAVAAAEAATSPAPSASTARARSPVRPGAAEEFQGENPDVKVTVGTSGTGGGFEKFCAGETDISERLASDQGRRRGARSARRTASTYTEVQVANDGIAVVTNTELKVDCMTADQLKQLWNKGSKVKSLSEVDPKLPGHRAEPVRPRHRLRHVRLLHRRDQR